MEPFRRDSWAVNLRVNGPWRFSRSQWNEGKQKASLLAERRNIECGLATDIKCEHEDLNSYDSLNTNTSENKNKQISNEIQINTDNAEDK